MKWTEVNSNLSSSIPMLKSFNSVIHHLSVKRYDYHMTHIHMVKEYLLLLNKRLYTNFDTNILSYIAYAHDLFKEKGLDPSRKIEWYDVIVPQDNNRYVRENLDVLAEYGLDDYFNTDVQYHALAAGIYVKKEFGINDPEILYPIFFHSCPIISIYETLDKKIQTLVDMMMLADKLSSNWLRINMLETSVRIDLDKLVFGESGYEFNYTMGLFTARIISQGNSKEVQSKIATDYYYKRLIETNPLISKNYSIKKLGENKTWEKRESQALKML